MAARAEAVGLSSVDSSSAAAQQRRTEALTAIREALAALKPLASVKYVEVGETYAEQATILNNLVDRLRAAEELEIEVLEKPAIGRRKTAAQLAADIKAFRALPDCDDVSVAAMEHQLALLGQWEKLRHWQEETAALMRKLEARREANRKSYDRTREMERKQKLLAKVLESRLLAGKQPLAADPKPSDVITLEFELPQAAAQLLLAPPVTLPRRLEKLHGVVVERPLERNRSRTLLIHVLESEQEPVAAMLRETDWANGTKVTLETKLVPLLIGKGGSALRTLEDSTGCIINVANDSGPETGVMIFGRNAAKAAAHIATLKAERPAETATATVPLDHPAIARALNHALVKKLRDVEKAHNVHMRVNFGPPFPTAADAVFGVDVASAPVDTSSVMPAASASPGGSKPGIILRGQDPASVNAAREAVVEVAAPLRCLEIPLADNEAARRLFSRVSFNGDVALARMRGGGTGGSSTPSTTAIGDKFFDLASSVVSNVAFLRHGDILAVVGSADQLAEVEAEARALAERAAHTTVKMKLAPHQVPIFTVDRIADVELRTGALVILTRTRTSGAEGMATWIEVTGSEKQKADAAAAVEEMLRTLAHQQSVQNLRNETVSRLLQDGAMSVKKLQAEHNVRISVDRTYSSVQVTGPEQGVKEAVKVIAAWDEDAKKMVTNSIPIPDPSMIGRLIGTKGATITNIRQKSGAAAVDVRDNNSVVVIKGLPQAVAKAVEMVQATFQRNGEAPAAAGGVGAKRTTPTYPARDGSGTIATTSDSMTAAGGPPRTAPVTVVAGSGAKTGTGGWGESVVPDNFTDVDTASSAPRGWQSMVHATDAAAPSAAGFFPALGEVMPQDDSGRSNRRARPARRVPRANKATA